MALSPDVPIVSPEEYLALERQADARHEYIDGVVVAMGGGSRDHSRIKVNLTALIHRQVAGRGCEAFDSDLRVRVDANRYTYPDLVVVCGESRFADRESDTLLNPTAIFEVLSPSTEAHDRGEKWARYRQMPSLQHYVLVGQDRPLVEVFTRAGDVWLFGDAEGLDASVALEAIGVALPLADVYARVEFGQGPRDDDAQRALADR